MVRSAALLWIFLLERGQCLGDSVGALDGQRSLAGSPSLDGARRNIEGRANGGSGAAELADDNLHGGTLSLWRAGVDHSAKPHDPAAGRHETNNAERLRRERDRTRRERGGALNPSVKSTDWLESHGSVVGWWGLLGGFAGGLEISERVTASKASLVGGGEVLAGKALAVKPGALSSKIKGERANRLAGGVKLCAQRLDLGLVNVATLTLVDDTAEVVALDASGFEVGFDFGKGAVCCVGHAQTLRKDFVGVQIYLRLFFVGCTSLLITLHNANVDAPAHDKTL